MSRDGGVTGFEFLVPKLSGRNAAGIEFLHLRKTDIEAFPAIGCEWVLEGGESRLIGGGPRSPKQMLSCPLS